MTTPQGPGDPGQQGDKPFEPMPAAPALNEQDMAPLTPANRPKSVDNAWLLWMIGAGLYVIVLIVSLTLGADDIRKSAEDSLKRTDPNYTQDELDNAVTVFTTLAVVIGLIFTGLFVLFAYKMRAGRNWARITLAILGGLNIVFTLINLGAVGGLEIVFRLAMAVLILAAVYYMYRPDANQYFAHGRVRR